MNKRATKAIAILLCFSLGACSSIGTINGVQLDGGQMGLTRHSERNDAFCEQNDQRRWLCILAIAGVGGGAIGAYLFRRAKKAPAPASSTPETPPSEPEDT